jgi:hypothetical protein
MLTPLSCDDQFGFSFRSEIEQSAFKFALEHLNEYLMALAPG